jgi:hypothetical protein
MDGEPNTVAVGGGVVFEIVNHPLAPRTAWIPFSDSHVGRCSWS